MGINERVPSETDIRRKAEVILSIPFSHGEQLHKASFEKVLTITAPAVEQALTNFRDAIRAEIATELEMEASRLTGEAKQAVASVAIDLRGEVHD